MATYNFNVKVTTGKRTTIDVQVYTSANDKVVEFKDSTLCSTNIDIGKKMKILITNWLKEQAAKNPKTF